MIFLGGNKLTVVVGLFLYSLLPVVRSNTYTGLSGIDPAVKRPKGWLDGQPYQLIHVGLPIAFPEMVFTGIRIAVINRPDQRGSFPEPFVGGGGLGTGAPAAWPIEYETDFVRNRFP